MTHADRVKKVFAPGAFQWQVNRDGNIGSIEWKRSEAVKQVWERLAAQEWEVATIFNFMPFRLRQRIGAVGEVTVPKCEFGTIYEKQVIEMPRIDVADLGGGKFAPQEILPVQLAKEVCDKYIRQDPPCAVFWYKGEAEPSQEQVAAAIDQRELWMNVMYRRGAASWAKNRDLTQISDNMKQAARYLNAAQTLRDLPDWVIVTKQEQLAHKSECEQCGELNNRTSKVCLVCHYPLNIEWVRDNRPDLVEKYPRLFLPVNKKAKEPVAKVSSGE